MPRLILSHRFGADAKRLEARLDGLDDRRRIEAISRRALGDVSLDEIERVLEFGELSSAPLDRSSIGGAAFELHSIK